MSKDNPDGSRPISKEYPLILASTSPRRKRLLEQIGLPFFPLTPDVEETLKPDDPFLDPSSRIKKPGELACFLAEKKARAVHSRSTDSWILGADTIVVLGAETLGKPGDQEEAQAMLNSLGGQEHKVTTGFCLLYPSGRVAHREEIITFVKMKRLTPEEIRTYITTGEPFGKAGGYAIQGIGSFMVESISGSYTNVVGLPLCALVKSLLKVGALKTFPLLT
ncbi:MAG: nucleoside triphosphate pyrophosphatase [Pseudomonadota bacterium]